MFIINKYQIIKWKMNMIDVNITKIFCSNKQKQKTDNLENNNFKRISKIHSNVT